jgi:hypothetical protein
VRQLELAAARGISHDSCYDKFSVVGDDRSIHQKLNLPSIVCPHLMRAKAVFSTAAASAEPFAVVAKPEVRGDDKWMTECAEILVI